MIDLTEEEVGAITVALTTRWIELSNGKVVDTPEGHCVALTMAVLPVVDVIIKAREEAS